MSEVYKVKNIKDTDDIIKASLNGATQFEVNEDELNACLSRYGLKLEDMNEIQNLLVNGKFSDWYKAAEDKKLPENLRNSMKMMVNEFSKKINSLRQTNPKLHRNMLTIIGYDFVDTVDENFIKNFELPIITDGVEDTVYGKS